MDFKDLQEEQRRRHIEELRRKYAKGEKLTQAPAEVERDSRDPDAPLISPETKEAAAKLGAKAADVSRQQLAALMDKAKDAQEKLRATAERLAQRRAEDDLGLPKPSRPIQLPAAEDEESPQPRAMPQWPSRRLWDAPLLATLAAVTWLAVGAGLWWTKVPSPMAERGEPAAPVETIDQAPLGEAADPIPAQTAIEPVSPDPLVSQSAPAPVPARPRDDQPARAPSRPIPPRASETSVDEQWTDEANAELDEWERVLREE